MRRRVIHGYVSGECSHTWQAVQAALLTIHMPGEPRKAAQDGCSASRRPGADQKGVGGYPRDSHPEPIAPPKEARGGRLNKPAMMATLNPQM